MELDFVETVLGICRQFHVLPSAVLAEDVELLRMLRIEKLGKKPEEVSQDHGE